MNRPLAIFLAAVATVAVALPITAQDRGDRGGGGGGGEFRGGGDEGYGGGGRRRGRGGDGFGGGFSEGGFQGGGFNSSGMGGISPGGMGALNQGGAFGPGGGLGGGGMNPYGGGGGRGGFGGGDMARRFDQNGDGVIGLDEMNDRVRSTLERAGMSTSAPIAVDRLSLVMELTGGGGRGGRGRGGDSEFRGGDYRNGGYYGLGEYGSLGGADALRSTATPSASSGSSLVPGFDYKAPTLPPVLGFGDAVAHTTLSLASTSSFNSSSSSSTSSTSSTSSGGSDPIRSWATSKMKEYDTNGDGKLDRDEASKMTDSQRYDRNGDGTITLDEMIEAQKNWRPGEDSSAAPTASSPSTRPGGGPAASPDSGVRQRGGRGGRGPGGFGAGGGNPTRPRSAALADLPNEFFQKDLDQDGQVMMHEYARAWTNELAAEFTRKDRNGDGIITPEEWLATAR